MVEQYIVDMEYKNYCAYTEMMETLEELSIRHSQAVTEAQVQVINELALGSITEWINKIIANIQQAWNNFKSGAKGSIWESYKKVHEGTFSSDFTMRIEKGAKIPIISEVYMISKIEVPEYDKNLDLKSQDDFLKSTAMKYLYEDGKNLQDVANSKAFKELENNMDVSSNSMPTYVKFMDEYESLSDNLAKDLHRINISSKAIQRKAQEAKKKAEADAKKKEEEAKKQAEEAKQAKEAETKTAQTKPTEAKPANGDTAGQVNVNATGESFIGVNVAKIFLESLVDEAKFSDANSSDNAKAETSTDGSSQEVISDEEIDGISVYWKTVSAVISCKMKTLDNCRKSSFDIIKHFCKLAEKKVKNDKKEAKKAEKEVKI